MTAPVEPHPYVVKWRWGNIDHEFSSASRHEALQVYIGARKATNDFGPADTAIVRIWHNGIEYMNEDDTGGSSAGKSLRTIHGPYIREERHMP